MFVNAANTTKVLINNQMNTTFVFWLCDSLICFLPIIPLVMILHDLAQM